MDQLSVIGSINLDIFVQVRVVPKQGETIVGDKLYLVPGGKGANQAIAACRMGLPTKFFGCIGDDVFGKLAISGLEKAGVDISNIKMISNQMTGVANVLLDHNGENRIIIIPGTNEFVSVDYVDQEWEKISKSSLILVQHEIPLETIYHVVRKAKSNGIKVMLNPAPFFAIPSDVLKLIDFLIINKIEAEALFCTSIDDKDSAFKAAIDNISKLEINSLIITLGEKGSILLSREKYIYQPAFKVEVIDTTGAGDTFVGSFAASIMKGESDQKSLLYASAAAALAVTTVGAQASIPDRNQVMNFIK